MDKYEQKAYIPNPFFSFSAKQNYQFDKDTLIMDARTLRKG